MRFSEWLRAEREKRGLMSQELAEQAGMSPSKLSRIENDKANATFSVAIELCHVLDIKVNELLRDLSEGSYAPPPYRQRPVEPKEVLDEELVLRFIKLVITDQSNDAFELLGRFWWSVEASNHRHNKRFFGPPINGNDISRFMCEGTTFSFLPSHHLETSMNLEKLEGIYLVGGIIAPSEAWNYLMELIDDRHTRYLPVITRIRRQVVAPNSWRALDIELNDVWEVENAVKDTRYFWQMTWDIVRFANTIASYTQSAKIFALQNLMIKLFRKRQIQAGEDRSWFAQFEAALVHLERTH